MERDAYSEQPVKFKGLTSHQLRELRFAKAQGRIAWRSAFMLLRRGLVTLGETPSVFECMMSLPRAVVLTPDGEAYLRHEEEREAALHQQRGCAQ